jgi:pyruvate/2-oxoacid:ferredoxin oxidoreductase beta subunit
MNATIEATIEPAAAAPQPLLCSGHAACPGCAEPLSLRHILDVLGPDTMAVIPPSCMAIIAGPQPFSSLRIPVYQPTLEASAAAASGCAARSTPGPSPTRR